MKVRDLLGRLWFLQELMIIKEGDFSPMGAEVMRDYALFTGNISAMSSVLYKDILDMIVVSFGQMDGYIIVEVK